MTVQGDGRRLRDKVAIVTGGANGIGRAYCLRLSAEGAKVVVADIDVGSAEETVRLIHGQGGKSLVVRTDIADQREIKELAAKANQEFGQIDILVNNAAIFGRPAVSRVPFWEINEQEWDRVMSVNIKGAWLCSCAVLPFMKLQKHGKIINQSSNVFHQGLPNYAHYVASRGAMIGLTRAMARELGPYNIQVNAIAPGSTLAEENPSAQRIANLERAAGARSIKRIQTPEDLVGALVFLASGDSDFITGQTFVVDGGAYMQ